jgi:NADP-dependent aldehyde dehydrogenase
MLIAGEATERFISAAKAAFDSAPPPALLSADVARSLGDSVKTLQKSGAQVVTDAKLTASGARHPNTLLRVSGEQFLADSANLQTEAFGATSLLVVARDAAEAARAIDCLEGNLTGSIYSESSGADEPLYAELAPRLRVRVGRLLNDKMPTGVAVSPAMNHGGPYPATGHAGFTAVGIPASLRRFAALQSYDNVRAGRLPDALRDRNPNGRMWRLIDGEWTRSDYDRNPA